MNSTGVALLEPGVNSAGVACVERGVRWLFAATLFALVCGVSLPSRADGDASACARDALAKVKARYGAVRDFRAGFSQESRSVALGGPGAVTRSRGEVVLARPGRMRWSYVEPEPSLVVSDGESLWIYEVGSGEAQKFAVSSSALSAAAVQFLLGDADVAENFAVRAESCEADRVGVHLTPLQPATYEHLRIIVDPATGEVSETEVVDLLGNTTRVAFTGVETNTSPAPSTFRFDAPEGVAVIEVTPEP